MQMIELFDAEPLTELFDRPLPVVWNAKTEKGWYGSFVVNDVEYLVSCVQQVDFVSPDYTIADLWELAFGVASDWLSWMTVVGTGGNEFLIFSTVANAFKEFITTVRPDFLNISAAKINTNRFGLFQRMVRKELSLLKSLGYTQVAPLKHIHKHKDPYKHFDAITFQRKNASVENTPPARS